MELNYLVRDAVKKAVSVLRGTANGQYVTPSEIRKHSNAAGMLAVENYLISKGLLNTDEVGNPTKLNNVIKSGANYITDVLDKNTKFLTQRVLAKYTTEDNSLYEYLASKYNNLVASNTLLLYNRNDISLSNPKVMQIVTNSENVLTLRPVSEYESQVQNFELRGRTFDNLSAEEQLIYLDKMYNIKC